MNVYRTFIRILIPVLCAPGVFAQAVEHDTTFLSQAVRNVIKQYRRVTAENSPLFNGTQYMPPVSVDGTQHPFLLTDDWLTGSVLYDRQHFEEIPLLYDITSDNLITETIAGQRIVLSKEKVTQFTLNGNKFIRIENSQVENSLPRTGFYQLLHDGNVRLIAMRKKNIHRQTEGMYVTIDFEQRDRYFLLKNGKYHAVKSQVSVLKILGDRKQTLKAYSRENDIRSYSNEQVLLKLTEYYNTITSVQ